MAGILKGVLGGIGEADVYGKGKFILPGNYLFEIQQITIDESKKDRGTYWFHAELEVVECDNDCVSRTENAPGETRTYSVKIPPGPADAVNKKMAFSNMKAFVMELDPSYAADDVDEDVFEEMCGPKQPAKGKLIRCEAWLGEPNDKTGKRFTNTIWSAVGEETGETGE